MCWSPCTSVISPVTVDVTRGAREARAAATCGDGGAFILAFAPNVHFRRANSPHDSVAGEIGRGQRLSHFLIFASRRVEQMAHPYDIAISRTKERSRDGDVLDIAAAQREATRHDVEVDVISERSFGRPDFLPDAAAGALVGKRKVHRESEAPDE